MSSIEPTNPHWPQPPRVNIWRWLSPLLLVSLGLHGLGVLVPLPDKPEEVEDSELEVLDSIQVSTLPLSLESELSSTEPEPPPVPPEVPPAPLEPPPPEPSPIQEEIFFEEFPLPEVPIEEKTLSQEDNFDDDQSQQNPVTKAAYNSEGTDERAAISNTGLFAARYVGVTIKPVDRKLELAYDSTDDSTEQCFEPPPGLIQIAVALNDGGGVLDSEILKSSGYPGDENGDGNIDAYVEDIIGFNQTLPSEAFEGLTINDGTVADWINETRTNRDDPRDSSLIQKTDDDRRVGLYAIEVEVTVANSDCQDI